MICSLSQETISREINEFFDFPNKFTGKFMIFGLISDKSEN